MTENAGKGSGYNKGDQFSDLWVQSEDPETESWTKIKGRKKVKKKNESLARQLLDNISEEKSEEVLGGAKTAGDNCPICKGTGSVPCKFCPADGGYDPVCGGKQIAWCTMCRGDQARADFAKKQKDPFNNSANRPQG